MKFYYFNNETDKHGRHEVHSEDCSYLPNFSNRTMVGLASDCHEALNKAKDKFPYKSFDGCFWCCRDCHKG